MSKASATLAFIGVALSLGGAAGHDDRVLLTTFGDPVAKQVRVFLGSASGIGTSANATLSLPDSEDGAFVASAGDVNGDGYGDIVTGLDEIGARFSGIPGPSWTQTGPTGAASHGVIGA